MKKISGIALVSIGCYIAFQIFADVLSTKIAFISMIGMAVDGGTIIYPLTFTVRDFLHKTIGKQMSRKVVLISGGLNLVMVCLFLFIGKLTPDQSWPFQQAYEQILMPIWRITIASIFAEVLSELLDTEIFSVIYRKTKRDVLASLTSNMFALLLDSVVFGVLAFAGTLPWEIVWQIVVANILIKTAMSVVSSPLIKFIPIQVSDDEM